MIDCVDRINCQKRKLVVCIVQTTKEKYHKSNVTVVLSGKYVGNAVIYIVAWSESFRIVNYSLKTILYSCFIFPQILGNLTIPKNRLVSLE